jgi:hypothetical protein
MRTAVAAPPRSQRPSAPSPDPAQVSLHRHPCTPLPTGTCCSPRAVSSQQPHAQLSARTAPQQSICQVTPPAHCSRHARCSEAGCKRACKPDGCHGRASASIRRAARAHAPVPAATRRPGAHAALSCRGATRQRPGSAQSLPHTPPLPCSAPPQRAPRRPAAAALRCAQGRAGVQARAARRAAGQRPRRGAARASLRGHGGFALGGSCQSQVRRPWRHHAWPAPAGC